MDAFDWDDTKAAENYSKHGVTFANAKLVFADPFAIERLDDRFDYGEDRFNIIGMVEGRLISVVYTSRNERIRIISARGAEPNERRWYMKTTPDAVANSSKDWSRFDAMTEEERHRAALLDPDAQPLSDADLARMRRTPQPKIIRRALALSQEEFSTRYLIPLGTLRDWEQGTSEPDQPARAYLRVIANDPEGVRKILGSS